MDWEGQIGRLIGLTPNFAVLLVGVILALKRLPKFPRPCWFLLAALLLDGFANLALPAFMQQVMSFISMNGYNFRGENQMLWMILWTVPYSLVSAVIWGLVLFAVFDRPDPPKFLVEDGLEQIDQDR